MTRFQEMIAARKALGLHICVGLDVRYYELPGAHRDRFANDPDDIFNALSTFTADVAFETSDQALCFKPNYTFAEGEDSANDHEVGHRVMYDAIWNRIRVNTPDIGVIVDRKGEEIGNSAKNTAHRVFDILGADATTISPWMGYEDSMDVFLNREDKFSFVLCRTSNRGSDVLQKGLRLIERSEAVIFPEATPIGEEAEIFHEGLYYYHHAPEYLYVAHLATRLWNRHGNVGLVVGANRPEELEAVCKIVAGTGVLLLIPGGKTQGGRPEVFVPILKRTGCMDQALINYSRDVLYPEKGQPSDGLNFAAQAAERLARAHEQIENLLAV